MYKRLLRERTTNTSGVKSMAAKKILIVDDEANIGASLQMVLEGEGYKVVLCSSAEEFRAQIPHTWADAYLLDVRLPGFDGLKVLRRAKESGSKSQFIVITAFDSREIGVRAIQGPPGNPHRGTHHPCHRSPKPPLLVPGIRRRLREQTLPKIPGAGPQRCLSEAY